MDKERVLAISKDHSLTTEAEVVERCALGDRRYWSTATELEFLEKLGTHAPECMVSRKELLQGYLASIPKRSNWLNMAPLKIKQRALQYLEDDAYG